MSTSYAVDAAQSRSDFQIFGRPALEKYFGTKLIFSSENHETDFETALDVQHGIDCLVIDNKGKIHGVSSRFQRGCCYSAFSRRRSRRSGALTEHDKDLWALKEGFVTADYTLQGFVTNNGLSAEVAIAPTSDIRDYIANNPDSYRVNRSDGATFYVIPWQDVNAKIYKNKTQTAFEQKK